MASRGIELLYLVLIAGGVLLAARGVIGLGGDAPQVVDETCAREGRGGTIVSVGDVLLGDAASKELERRGYDYPFRTVAPLLRDAHVVMGNLEAPITEHDEQYIADKQWSYRQLPAVADALADAGFDVLALANNHTLDYGPQGLADTLEQLQRVDISPIGAGADEEDARRGVVVQVGDTSVGLLAYMEPYGKYDKQQWFADGDRPGAAKLDLDAIQLDIARLRAEADLVIVHAHFGRNYKPPTRYQQRTAHALIDLGADVVNGHHPHVAQGVEIYKGKPILYSLGNFTFGTPGRFERGQQGYGMVARYHVCDGELRQIELDLIGTNNKLVRYQPGTIGETEARAVMADLLADYDTEVRWVRSTAVIDLP